MKLPSTLYRAVSIDQDATRAAGDALQIAISSEEPVGRFFGDEILDHSSRALDMRRLERGLPLCMDHDQTRVMGRVEQLAVSGGVLRGTVRFSDSPEAKQLESDMRAGIRPDISVGYAVDAMELVGREGDHATYRVTRWRPLECSSVAVPADETVGVGRAADRPADAFIDVPVTGERSMENTATPTPEAKVEVRTVVDHSEERKRASEITQLAETYGFREKAADWISQGADIATVQREILAGVQARAKAQTELKNPVPLTEKEDKQYSLRRALMAKIANPESDIGGFEGEVHQELVKQRAKAGISSRNGLVIPTALRTGVVGTSSLGGALRFTEHGDFIQMLRNATFIGQTGARFMTGLQGNVAMPKQLTGGTAYWLAEAGTVTNADLTFSLVTLSPKTLMYSYGVSRQFLAQSADDVEQILRADYVQSQVRELDRVALVGTSTSNEPTGILNDSNVNQIAVGANGGAITWANVVKLSGTVAVNNGVLNETAAWVTNGKVSTDLKNTYKGTAGFMPVWDGPAGGAVMDGYKAFVSSSVPSNLTKGTSTTICSVLAFASAWNEMLIGQWGGGGFAEVIVDPYSQKKTGIVELTSFALLDIQLRNSKSFGYIKDITTSL